jgi:hypothetical protein
MPDVEVDGCQPCARAVDKLEEVNAEKVAASFANGQPLFHPEKGVLTLLDSGAGICLAPESLLSDVRLGPTKLVALADKSVVELNQVGDFTVEMPLDNGKPYRLTIKNTYVCETALPILSATVLDKGGVQLSRVFYGGRLRGTPCLDFRLISEGSVKAVMPLSNTYNAYLKPVDPKVVASVRESLRGQRGEAARATKSVAAVALRQPGAKSRLSGAKVHFAKKLAHVVAYVVDTKGEGFDRYPYGKKYQLSRWKRNQLQWRLQAALGRACRLEASEARAAAAAQSSKSAETQTAATAQPEAANVAAVEVEKGAAAAVEKGVVVAEMQEAAAAAAARTLTQPPGNAAARPLRK